MNQSVVVKVMFLSSVDNEHRLSVIQLLWRRERAFLISAGYPNEQKSESMSWCTMILSNKCSERSLAEFEFWNRGRAVTPITLIYLIQYCTVVRENKTLLKFQKIVGWYNKFWVWYKKSFSLNSQGLNQSCPEVDWQYTNDIRGISEVCSQWPVWSWQKVQ